MSVQAFTTLDTFKCTELEQHIITLQKLSEE